LKFADDLEIIFVGVVFGHFKPNPIPLGLTGFIGLEDVEDRFHVVLGLGSKEYDQKQPHDLAFREGVDDQCSLLACIIREA
jgi:hypothetical protein